MSTTLNVTANIQDGEVSVDRNGFSTKVVWRGASNGTEAVAEAIEDALKFSLETKVERRVLRPWL